MTLGPVELAAIHAAANQVDRAWTPTDFDTFLQSGAILTGDARGFVLGRIVADEAEILTLATHPDYRREGHARTQLALFEVHAAAKGATQLFLEVASDNLAARALYAAAGFHEVGQRRAYYARPDGQPADALVLRKDLTQG